MNFANTRINFIGRQSLNKITPKKEERVEEKKLEESKETEAKCIEKNKVQKEVDLPSFDLSAHLRKIEIGGGLPIINIQTLTEPKKEELTPEAMEEFMAEYEEINSLTGKIMELFQKCKVTVSNEEKKELVEKFLSDNNITRVTAEQLLGAFQNDESNKTSGSMGQMRQTLMLSRVMVSGKQNELVQEMLDKYGIDDVKPNIVQNYLNTIPIGGTQPTAEDLFNALSGNPSDLALKTLIADYNTLPKIDSMTLNTELTFFSFGLENEDNKKETAQNFIDRYGLTDITPEELLDRVQNGDVNELADELNNKKQKEFVSEFLEKHDINTSYADAVIKILNLQTYKQGQMNLKYTDEMKMNNIRSAINFLTTRDEAINENFSFTD